MQTLSFLSMILFALFVVVINSESSSQGQGDAGKVAGSVAGRVTVKGKPAPGLEVKLRTLYGYDTLSSAKTDAQGNYKIPVVPAGKFWINVQASEYITDGRYSDEGPGREVTVANGESVENADINLIPGSVISGRVMDADGKPVAGEEIELFSVEERRHHNDSFWLSGGFFKTDAQGNYRLYSVPPGRYVIAVGVDVAALMGEKQRGDVGGLARVNSDRFYEQRYYPGVTEREKAQVIEVKPESDIKNINITAGKPLPAYRVKGRVVNAETGKPMANCRLAVGQERTGGARPRQVGESINTFSIGSVSRRRSYVMNESSDEKGNFEIKGLLPMRSSVSAYFGEADEQSDYYSDEVEFDIIDKDVTGLVISVRRGVKLSGSVVIEGDGCEKGREELSTISLQVRGDKMPFGKSAKISADGSFSVSGLRQNSSVEMDYRPMRFFEKTSFTLLRVEHPAAQDKTRPSGIPGYTSWQLEIGKEDLTDVRLVFRCDSGAINGHVRIVGGKLPPGARASVSLHFFAENGGSSSTSREIVDDGNFSFGGLESGLYVVHFGVAESGRVFAEPKPIRLAANEVTQVNFEFDVAKLKKP